jgi:branched-chain amino acid transport system substrate-binding protein
MRLMRLFLPVCILLVSPVQIIAYTYTSQTPIEKSDSIKIGLLIQDSKSYDPEHGAELAVLKANRNGGCNGKPFQLLVRSMEGPWGTGSKQAVKLIFDNKVLALMGSHDGRNAHLVEQVSAKTRIVFLSAWSGDPTLAKAFIPWFFNCVPNFDQQADALIDEICNKRKIIRIATISDNSYDSRMALNSFTRKLEITGITDPLNCSYKDSTQDFSVMLNQISKAGAEAIVMFGQKRPSLRLIQQIRQRKMDKALFSTLPLIGEDGVSASGLNDYEGIVFVSSDYLINQNSVTFRKEFQDLYGKTPGPSAAYAFDGMNLIIEAIRNSGTEREQIQKYLLNVRYKGVTGLIQFDENGNRKGYARLMEIRNGFPVQVGKD